MRRRQAIAFASIALASIGCDHATKQVAQHVLGLEGGFSWAGDTLRFQLVSNPGAFLSLGASLPEPLRHALLLVAVPLLLLVLSAALLRGQSPGSREIAALGLVVGGGMANWLDRLLNDGTVTDFVSLGLGPLRTGIFNLADVAVMAGLVLLILPAGLFATRRRAS